MFNFSNQTKQHLEELDVILSTLEASLNHALRKERSDRDYALEVGLDKAGIYQKALKPKLLDLLINPSIYKKLSLLAKNEGLDYDNLLVELTYSLEGFEEVNKETGYAEVEKVNDALRQSIQQVRNLLKMI
jgi:uncharacterized protein YukE